MFWETIWVKSTALLPHMLSAALLTEASHWFILTFSVHDVLAPYAVPFPFARQSVDSESQCVNIVSIYSNTRLTTYENSAMTINQKSIQIYIGNVSIYQNISK